MDSNLQTTLVRTGLVLFLIITFSGPIKGVLISIQQAISKSNKTNIKFKDLTIDLSNNSQSFQVNQLHNHNLQLAFRSPIIVNGQGLIRKQLADANLSLENQTDLLINALSYTKLNLYMLMVDKKLSIEQRGLLSYLNRNNIPIEQSNLLHFFERWQKKHKGSNYSFSQFLNDLLTLKLISKNISSYNITTLGREYLIFRVRLGNSTNFDNIFANNDVSDIDSTTQPKLKNIYQLPPIP